MVFIADKFMPVGEIIGIHDIGIQNIKNLGW